MKWFIVIDVLHLKFQHSHNCFSSHITSFTAIITYEAFEKSGENLTKLCSYRFCHLNYLQRQYNLDTLKQRGNTQLEQIFNDEKLYMGIDFIFLVHMLRHIAASTSIIKSMSEMHKLPCDD